MASVEHDVLRGGGPLPHPGCRSQPVASVATDIQRAGPGSAIPSLCSGSSGTGSSGDSTVFRRRRRVRHVAGHRCRGPAGGVSVCVPGTFRPHVDRSGMSQVVEVGCGAEPVADRRTGRGEDAAGRTDPTGWADCRHGANLRRREIDRSSPAPEKRLSATASRKSLAGGCGRASWLFSRTSNHICDGAVVEIP